jgi:cyclopropane fatty-acyl-phospholipid synthase-like methyltransferase
VRRGILANMPDKKTITEYYDYTLPFYKIFWHGSANGIHYGFWDQETKNHKEALLNTNKFLAAKANISKNDVVLDAGCGIGGSAIWIAKNIKAKVTGITISQKQVEEAGKIAKKNGLAELATFYKRDFLNTGFENGSFTVVWAIESVCHAENKKEFLKEAYRLLKPGGRLIIDDGFLLRDIQNPKEAQDLKNFLEGLAVPNLSHENDFHKYLEETGFKNIKAWNKVMEATPSARKIRNMSVFSYPLSMATEKLGITSGILTKNNLAGLAQYKIIKSGLMGHLVFYAEK